MSSPVDLDSSDGAKDKPFAERPTDEMNHDHPPKEH